jgi:cardiolipin synthase
VQVISNDLRKGRQGIERAYRQAIQRAKRRVRITNAYFLPTLRLLGALVGAARRGVDVRVIVAGTTDVPAVLLASRSIYGPLLSAGVRIFEYRGRVLHAKTATVDGVFSTVGSSNLDTQSLRQNLEVNAFVRDERFAAALESMFDEDLASSVEITPDVWERRGLLERAASWGAYLFKELL